MNTTSTGNKNFSIEPDRSRLLAELWYHQLDQRYISNKAIHALAQTHQLAEIDVEGVATFYHFFHRQPAGKHTIYLNNSIISELRGFERIKEAFERETGAKAGTVDQTGTFGFFITPCIGLSDQEPAALIDFYPFTHLNALKVKEIIHHLRQGRKPEEICDTVQDNIRYKPIDERTLFFAPYTRGKAIGNIDALKPEGVIEQLRISQLAGRGGAFYPTWQKWEACRKQTASPKFIVCNADEGEPGTFKDRVLLSNQPGSLLEGMIIAGYTVGATYGIIYLRGEYRWLVKSLEEEIAQFHEHGLLGKDVSGIKGFDFDIRLEIGAGAYVCGEETALLESMEGKRGEPRTKWFYPIERGYLQLPTVVNNVETFCAVARLIEVGSFEYLKRGIPGSPGTKLISVSGDCKLPGLYEIEWGMTVAELLELCGADDPYFIQVSGPSGECISIKEKYRRISMLDLLAQKDIRCGGSFMIFNRHRDIVSILMNFSHFFKHESCGVCTPCRAGNFIIQRKLERLQNGLADMNDLTEMKNWGTIMKATSRCGLGKTASNAILQSIDKFHDYFAARYSVTEDGANKKFDLESAVADYEHYKP
ncbi:MAG: NAD(P)H-dependent oxidoreductase subunit E [Cyclobacteriaceae bacterium]|nr:NAD(P)H-dependent oxidoreductase subunit E [Cyclobacteriaceae bacterium]